MIILGDSIAEGLGQQFPGARTYARVGASTRAILAMIPDQFPVGVPVIISAGSNDLRDSPALEAALRALRSGIPPALPVIWILPANEARPAVERVAEIRGDTTVAFTPGRDGIHPRSYRALADDVRAVIGDFPTTESVLPPETPMRDSFPRALQLVLVHEGGWADHPNDPGGATMKGITIATFRKYLKRPDATKTELRNISDETVAAIYRRNYWNHIRGDQLPAGIDYALFDFAVNSGPTRAVKMLQKVIGLTGDDIDGKVGPQTIAKINAVRAATAILDLCAARLDWLETLRTWNSFGRGWTSRIVDVQRDALKMIGDPQFIPQSPLPDPEDATRGDPAPTKPPVTGTDVAAGGGFLAAIGAAVATGAKWAIVAALVIGAGYVVLRVVKASKANQSRP
jgi:lysozyme family protein